MTAWARSLSSRSPERALRSRRRLAAAWGRTVFLRFLIAETSTLAFCDLSSIRLVFDVVSKEAADGQDMTFLAGPESFWERARLTTRGVTQEDIIHYGRHHNLQNLLDGEIKRKNDSIESSYTSLNQDTNTATSVRLAKRRSMRCIMPIRFGYFQQSMYHFMPFGNIGVEMQCAQQMEAIQSTGTAYANGWEIQNAVILCDILRVTPEFANDFSQGLALGSLYNISSVGYSTIELQMTAADNSFSATISQALTRIRGAFITFLGQPTAGAREGQAVIFPERRCKKSNMFFNPADGDQEADNTPGQQLEMYVTLGAKTYPIGYFQQGSRQMFYHLRRGLGRLRDSDLNIPSYQAYLRTHFVSYVSFEKARSGDGAYTTAFSGESTMTGDVLRVVVKNMRKQPTFCYVTLVYDYIAQYSGAGANMLR